MSNFVTTAEALQHVFAALPLTLPSSVMHDCPLTASSIKRLHDVVVLGFLRP